MTGGRVRYQRDLDFRHETDTVQASVIRPTSGVVHPERRYGLNDGRHV
jgi:hypothetical protein